MPTRSARPSATGGPARWPIVRAPLIAAALIATGVAALGRPATAMAALVAALALAAAMRVRPRDALGRLAHVEGFLVVLLVFLPFSTPGRTVLCLSPLRASAEGLALGLLIALKVNAVALTLVALLGAAAPERLGSALMSLGSAGAVRPAVGAAAAPQPHGARQPAPPV